jgi:hypothetical protein
MNVVMFRPRPRRSIDGLFWARPLEYQHRRVRELYRARFTRAQIAATVRLSEEAVTRILGVQS